MKKNPDITKEMEQDRNQERPEWIELFRQGDDKALVYFFDLYHKSLRYFASRMVPDSEDAEDIVSDCFLKLWERKKAFQTAQNIKAFLYISCRNACFNHLKHLKVITTAQQEYLKQFEEGEEPILYDMIRTEVLEILADEIRQLPEKCREVFKLIYFEGRNTDEIAKELNISVKTVRNHKARAVDLLKASFLKMRLSNTLYLALFLLIQTYGKHDM